MVSLVTQLGGEIKTGTIIEPFKPKYILLTLLPIRLVVITLGIEERCQKKTKI